MDTPLPYCSFESNLMWPSMDAKPATRDGKIFEEEKDNMGDVAAYPALKHDLIMFDGCFVKQALDACPERTAPKQDVKQVSGKLEIEVHKPIYRRIKRITKELQRKDYVSGEEYCTVLAQDKIPV